MDDKSRTVEEVLAVIARGAYSCAIAEFAGIVTVSVVADDVPAPALSADESPHTVTDASPWTACSSL